MPFTFSHPAIVVPLRRCGLPLSALVAGSIAPDLCFYLRPIATPDRFGHLFPGVLFFSLPAAFLSLWIFHRFLKAPLIAMAPRRYRAALEPFTTRFDFLPLARLARVSAAIAIGILSHLLWDFFCHLNGWSGAPRAMLASPLVDSPLGPIRLFEALHVSFSLAGAFLILWWLQRWATSDATSRPSANRNPRHIPAPHHRTILAILRTNRRRLGVAVATLAGVTLAAALVIGLLAGYTPDTCAGRRALLHQTVVIAISLGMAEAILLSLFWHAVPAFRPVSASQSQPNKKESADEPQ